MRRYIVHYTSMVIVAASAEEAIARAEDQGGGNWEAHPLELTLDDFVADEENDFICPESDAVFSPKEYNSLASMMDVVKKHIEEEHAEA